MKPILAALALIAVMTGCSRVIVLPEQDRMIRRVYDVKLSADDIYTRSLDWLASNLTTTRDSIEVKDKDRRKIIGRGSGKYSEYFNFFVDRQFGYTVTIEARDNRYRLTYDNFVVYYEEREVKPSPARYKFEINKIRARLEKNADDLYQYMQKGVPKEGEKDSGKKEDEEKW